MDRISRSRQAGDRIPKNTLTVTRGTHFGNYIGKKKKTKAEQKAAFDEWIRRPEQVGLINEFLERCVVDEIKHIACWCKAGEKNCHGETWLKIWKEAEKRNRER